MPSYIDASVVIAILRGEASAPVAEALWSAADSRVSSLLLRAECVTVLRRAASLVPGPQRAAWRVAARARLNGMLEAVMLKTFDDSVLHVLESEERLGACRTLDAIHLATALLLREHCDDPADLVVCTFDERMASASRTVGLTVAPGGF